MSKLTYIIVLAVVLAIATLTYQLSKSIDKPTTATVRGLLHNPDYFISEFNATKYDRHGDADYKLTAQYLEHFPDTRTIDITKLTVDYIDKNQTTWQVSANQGTGYEDTEILDVSGNVKISRLTATPDKNLQLITDRLHIDFPAKQANTETEVKIIGKNSTIKAKGMDINLEDGTVILRSEARGQYVPR